MEQEQNTHKSEQLRLDAKAAFEATEFDRAIELLSLASQADANNFQVHLDLVRMYLHTGHVEQAADLFKKLPEEARLSAEGKPLNLLLTCADIVSHAPSLDQIQTALQQDPNNAEMLYNLSGYLMMNHGYEEAMKTLLKLFSIQRDFKDGIAQKILLQLFEVLQADAPEMVTHYRRKLQGLLF